MILQACIAMIAGCLQRHRQVHYLSPRKNRVLKVHLGVQRLRLIDTDRRRSYTGSLSLCVSNAQTVSLGERERPLRRRLERT